MADQLRELEAELYDLITAPEGVGKRLAERGRTPADLARIVRPNDRMSAVARLDVYADMYFHRILDVLRDEYAKLLAVVGDRAFHDLVTDYLLAHRPAHPSLREAGAALPAYLAQHPLARERRWLAELARLERTHLELFDGPDAAVLTLEAVRALPPEELPATVLRAIPCHAVLHHRDAVAALWKSPARAADGPLDERTETILVWRQDFAVFHREVPPDEEPLLAPLAAGASFESLCTLLLASVPEESAAARAFELLAGWLRDGLLRA